VITLAELKQKNNDIYKKKRSSLFIIPLCIFVVMQIFRYAIKHYGFELLPTTTGEEWYVYAMTLIYKLVKDASWLCLIIVIVFFGGKSRTCKHCMTWNSMKKVRVDLIDRRNTAIRENRTSNSTIYDTSAGIPVDIGTITTQYDVDVPATRDTNLITYQCNCCGCTKKKIVSRTY